MGDRNTGIGRDQLRDYTLKRQDLSPDGLVWQEPVIDKDLTSPPGASEDDRYLIISGTGDWSGHNNDIAHYHGEQWNYYTPIEGWFIWVNDENKLYRFDGSSWAEFEAGTGGGASESTSYSRSFINSDLTANKITITHNLTTPYPLVQVFDNSDNLILPTEITYKTTDTVELDFTGLTPLTGTYNVRVVAGGAGSSTYKTTFVDGDLSSGILTVTHNLNVEHPIIQVYDNNDKVISPDEVEYKTIDSLEVDLSSYGTLTGTWKVRVVGGAWSQDKIKDDDGDTYWQALEDYLKGVVGGVQRALLNADGLKLESGADVKEFSIDNTLGDDSDDAVPTEKAVKGYVDNSLAGISSDKINEGDTKVEVVDAGTGYIQFQVDGEEQLRLIDGKLYPLTDDDIIVGDATHRIKELHLMPSSLYLGDTHITEQAYNRNEMNIMLNAFRIAYTASLSIFNMVDGIADEYEDETGIDTVNSLNEDYDSGNDLYKPSVVVGLELDYMEYANDGAAQAAYVTDASGLTLDLMEYASDGVAQAAYVSDALAETVNQQQTTQNDSEVLGRTGTLEYRQAQGFILSGTKTVTTVELYNVSEVGSPIGNWTVRIETDSSGKPSGTLAHANASVEVVPPAAGNTIKATFATFFILSASTTYHIVVLCDNQINNNYWLLGVATGNLYANGTLNVSDNGGSSWSVSATKDLWFKVYVAGGDPYLQSFSENSIINQGTYSLKAVADITDSLNKTLTKPGEVIESFTNGGTYDQFSYDTNTYGSAQGFQLSAGASISKVSFPLKAAGATSLPTGNATLEIQTDSGGLPSNTPVANGISQPVNFTGLPTEYIWTDFTFSTPPSLSASTLYHLVIKPDWSASASYVKIDANGGSAYANGDYAYCNSSWVWTAYSNFDILFRIYESMSLDLTDKDELKLDVRASRTGTNLQVQLVNGEEVVDQQQTTVTESCWLGNNDNVEYRAGQTFKLSDTKTITAIELYLDTKVGSPTGNWTIRIETTVDDKPTGTLAHANASMVVSPIASTSTSEKYSFATPFSLAGSTLFAIVMLCDNQANNNCWGIGRTDNQYADGTRVYSNDGGSSWLTIGHDLWFKVYTETVHTKDIAISSADTFETTTWDISGIANGDKDDITKIKFKILNADSATTYYIDNFRVPEGLASYSEDTIINQGTYSLKTIANQTASLNKTLTKSSLSLDLTDKDELKIDVRSSRTGTNLQARLYDGVGGWITKDINITSADEFQEFIWDISGVDNGDKADITKIEFKILNADSATTYYIDNFRVDGVTNNMTLISDSFTADVEPDSARIVLFEEDVDSITLQTDLKAYVSKDGGVTWAQVTLADEGNYETDKQILTGIADLTASGIGSGTNIEYKIETLNSKSLKLHGVGLHWD